MKNVPFLGCYKVLMAFFVLLGTSGRSLIEGSNVTGLAGTQTFSVF
jgi:hypothetical protein